MNRVKIKYSKPAYIHTRAPQKGFSLVAVLVSATILGLISVGFIQMLSSGNRSLAHSEIRQDLVLLTNNLENLIDCGKTFTGVNLAADCSASSLKPLQLKNRNGSLIGNDWKGWTSGVFDPLSKNDLGSSAQGKYRIRAYCDSAAKTLIVRFASMAGPNFRTDPSNRQPMDWTYSNRNPLFGTADRKMCEKIFGGGGAADNGGWAPISYTGAINSGGNIHTQRTAGNKPPSQFCIDAGFTVATGGCRGTWGTIVFEGSNLANNNPGVWFHCCYFGNAWCAPATEISCLK